MSTLMTTVEHIFAFAGAFVFGAAAAAMFIF